MFSRQNAPNYEGRLVNGQAQSRLRSSRCDRFLCLTLNKFPSQMSA